MGWNITDFNEDIQRQIRQQQNGTAPSKDKSTTDKQTIFIDELPPGLNGSKGLMQLHWSDYRDLKKEWVLRMQAEKPKAHDGRVNIVYTRKSVQMMDYDNLAASFKPVGDALEACAVISDDSPATINRFEVAWEKADTYREQGIRIEITNVE